MRVIVCGDRDHLAHRAADHVASLIDGTPLSLGLAGGSTPGPVYERLAGSDLPWESVTLWLGDERWVPADDPESNTGMAARLLADHVAADFLPFPYDGAETPERAAAEYSRSLEALGDRRRVVLLGMGDDGHTASLFPGTDALTATGIYVATWVPSKSVWRATATFDYLAGSEGLVFLVAGEDKAGVLARVLDGDRSFPAGELVARAGARTTWIIDAAAASELSGIS